VQRRRRKKAAPKNVFGSVPQSSQKSKPSQSKRPPASRARAQIAPPPSVPGAKPKPKIDPVKIPELTAPESLEESTIEDPIISEEAESKDEEKTPDEIIEEQLLGENDGKDIRLEKEEVPTHAEQSTDVNSGKSLKARQIIQDSLLKASLAVEEAKIQKSAPVVAPSTTKEGPKKPQRKFRNRNSSYQPANRARRLDRSRHMEYKYEMRGLLVEIDVAEEHRSNLLATIWARGERQTTNEAKEFLVEKLTEGVIDEDQMNTLEKIVDGYTVRR